jgi:hypothetical protein
MFQDLIGRISAFSPESAASGLEAVSGGILAASKTDSLGSVQSLLERFSTDPGSVDVWENPSTVPPQGWGHFQEPANFLQHAGTPSGSPYSFADVAQHLQDGEFNQSSVLSDVFDSFFGGDTSISNLIGNIFGHLAPAPQQNFSAGFDNPFADVMMNAQPNSPAVGGSEQQNLSSLDDLTSKLSGGADEDIRGALAAFANTLQDFQSVVNDSVNLQQDFRFRGGFRI